MKILIYSDVHLEFSSFEASSCDYDVVILAGDIGVGIQGVEWALAAFNETPVIYLFGNHEFYHHNLTDVKTAAKDLARGTNVHVLDDDSVVIDGVNFLGSTLWTDFNLYGNSVLAKSMAQMYMNDYRVIKFENRYLLPDDTESFFHASKKFLISEVMNSLDQNSKIVIATHHAPSRLSLKGERIDDEFAVAYASSMDEFIGQCGAGLWVHGHTHESADYRIGDTRVVSNPRGYSRFANGTRNSHFIHDCIIEI